MVELTRFGVWNVGLGNQDPAALDDVQSAAAELEDLGYGAIWIGGSPQVDRAVPLLEATSGIAVATGIASIWADEPVVVARKYAEVEAAHPGRFLLGLGASHAVLHQQYSKPYSAMVSFLDGLDAAEAPVPADRRVLAALGPRMLELSRDRARGAHPYLVTPEHTAEARRILGPGALLAPEVKVLLDADATTARATAREHLAVYLSLPNYLANLRRLGFTEEDLAGGGSDRLVDTTVAWGRHSAIRDRIAEYVDAGADHIVLQVVTASERMDLPRDGWRELAALLDLHNHAKAG
jgi:probable F420-dependent oxidoreductase